jgi:lysophospholipase L1-like esterase
MFKSRRSFYRKKRRQSLPLPAILAAIPLILILLELLARLLVGFAGESAELAAYQGEPAIVSAYRLKFLDETQQPYDGLSERGQLAAQRQLAVGYSLVGDQQSQFWQINEQGFRDDDPLPVEKPQNEIRIFLLGGSTAFGQHSTSNQATIASKLEARLNERVAQQKRSPEKYQPATLSYFLDEQQEALALPPRLREGQYRVLDAAVPGYASGNELAQLALQILPYSPDAIVVLDGYKDLVLPSQQDSTDIPKTEAFLQNATGHFWAHLTRGIKQAVANSYLVKATQYWLLRPQPSVSQLSLAIGEDTKPLGRHLTADAAELERRVARYREHHQQMVKLTTGAGIPLAIALQPEITGREGTQIADERALLRELGATYKQRVQAGYEALARANQQLEQAYPNNVKTLNFYAINESVAPEEQAFTDAIHLTEAANQSISEILYQALAASQKLQVPPPKPPQ